LSQDKFWEQWSKGGDDKPGEPAKPEEPAAGGSAADDILAAWLQALPPDDPTKEVKQTGAPALSGGWPTTAAVDPFSGIGKSNAANSSPSEWDLALDVTPTAATPPAAPQPPAAATAPSPPASGSGLGDFSMDLSGLAGPAPAANPFAPPPVHDVTPVAAPVVSPFGPPVPPVSPSREALQAAPLRVEVRTGRRTTEVECKGEALIGRPDTTRGIHPEIDLRLDDAVSRRHAKIFIRDGQYVLTDLNSTNGTRVNGQWVQPEMEVQLKPGDEIEVGELTVIRVLEAPNPDA
jgi:hypothetical protein